MRHYEHLARYKGVCGGRTVIKGTRTEPMHIVGYGSMNEIINHFGIIREQVIECYHYHFNSQVGAKEDAAAIERDWQAVGDTFNSVLGLK